MAAVQRRLSAIVCADVVGYSRLMGADESGTLAVLKGHRQAIDPIIAANGGRIVKTTGDGLLLEFPSVFEAVRTGIAVQQLMAERNAAVTGDRKMLLRIGVHLGDVIIDDDDIFGDGVNIAARLQEIAEPGGVCLSQVVHDSVRTKVEAIFADGGTQSLKNIAEPVRVYRLVSHAERAASASVAEATGKRLSIVVLPFTNLSRDPEQEYFADGITESLTTELSRLSGSFVISRNTAFTYKGKPVDVKQVGRELGVRYVLEGSVQTAATRVRVNAQLIDAESGAHLWADRFDSQRADLFDLQDDIVTRLARTLNLELTAAEASRAERLRTQNPDSTDLAMRGRALLNRGRDPVNWRNAMGLFEAALALDERNVEALCGLASAHGMLGFNWVTDQRAEHFRLAEDAARKALVLAPNSPSAHFALGRVLIGTDRGEEAVGEFERALALDRNMVAVHGVIAMSKRFLARPEESEAHALEAIRLSPRDASVGGWYFQIGAAALQMGDFPKAVTWLRRSTEVDRNTPWNYTFLASALAQQGQMEEARAAAATALAIDPAFKIGRMQGDGAPSRKPQFLAQWETVLDGMRKAGLPET